MFTKPRIFISSTCYDLADLRAELAAFLKVNGFDVCVSEDYLSSFSVEPDKDSIASCLANVESSDFVLVIFDRRYGPSLGHPVYGDLSATHAEINHAISLKRPMHYFVRRAAFAEIDIARANPEARLRWLEKQQSARLVALFQELRQLPEHSDRSNWFDQFEDVVDLKPIVLKRLLDRFPQYSIAAALEPSRFPRLHFVPQTLETTSGRTLHGHFRNSGAAPAFNVSHGVSAFSLKRPDKVWFCGALAPGEAITGGEQRDLPYGAHNLAEPHVFAEYMNGLGDRYRVEVVYAASGSAYRVTWPDRLFVGIPKSGGGEIEWARVGAQ